MGVNFRVRVMRPGGAGGAAGVRAMVGSVTVKLSGGD